MLKTNLQSMRGLFALALFSFAQTLFASVYTLPTADAALIGKIRYIQPNAGENIFDIQKQYDVGFNAIKAANPHLNLLTPFPQTTIIAIPDQHLLPNEKRKGIVINLPEMRLYYYVPNSNEVSTYPTGIGKAGSTIPIKNTTVQRKVKNPAWIPTPNIREFNLKNGIDLPTVMPAGPDNPLGPYAIYTGIPTYLMHSTIYPESIGTRASFGCIRMYEADVEALFNDVSRGTPITIINQPIKADFDQETLYLEAYPPLEEHKSDYGASLPSIVHLLENKTANTPTLIDWQLVAFINKERDGMPHEIGKKLIFSAQ